MDLHKKTVLITGASSGIGEACARKFSSMGFNLILIARRLEKLEELKKEITENHEIQCFIYQLDVRNRDDVFVFTDKIPDQFRNIDVLVNNAGLASGLAPIQNGDFSDWDIMIDTNLKGLLNMTRAILPKMIENGSGHIINIGSIAGHYSYPNGGVYCATKFGVRALTQGLLMDLVDTPIRVTTVDPGMVETEFSLVRFHGDADKANSTYDRLTPLTGGDVADAVYYCAQCPKHVNISEMVILPTDQASPYHVHREG